MHFLTGLACFYLLQALAIEQSKSDSQLTQTMQHLIGNPKAVDIAQRFVAKDDRMTVASQIVAKEKELHEDYYTFVHGHNAGYYFPLKIYTFLWQIRKQKELKNFIFPAAVPIIENENEKAEEERFRIHALEYGMGSDSKCLSMNYALFANVTNIGSSTSYRIAKGAGRRSIFITPADPFKILKYEAIYEKFKSEIEALAEEYNKKSASGNVLLIAIPKSQIREYVYPAYAAGYITSVYIRGIGKTLDMKAIMETLRNNPEKIRNTDQIEFCLILTQKNGGLDPDTGIKIFPILSGDPTKINELQKKEEILFAKIKKSIAEEKSQAQALKRAKIIVEHLTP